MKTENQRPVVALGIHHGPDAFCGSTYIYMPIADIGIVVYSFFLYGNMISCGRPLFPERPMAALDYCYRYDPFRIVAVTKGLMLAAVAKLSMEAAPYLSAQSDLTY